MTGSEITRDNNGSLSDSSFDVESEENFDRRRGHAPAGHSGPSRLANSPHQHRRNAPGRPSTRHGAPQPPPPSTSYSSRQQQQQHDHRRHHRPQPVGDPEATLDRRSTMTPGAPAGRSHKGGGKTPSDTYSQQQSRLFVALFDYDPQTMSPNQNAINDELPFTEGQIIKVHDTLLRCRRICAVGRSRYGGANE